MPYQKDKRQNHISSQQTQKKAFDKVQHSFMTEAVKKLGVEDSFFNLMKSML